MRFFRHFVLTVTVVLSVFLTHPAWANMANPNILDITQPDGSQIQLRFRGTGKLNWYEDLNGFPVEQVNGVFVYQRSVDPNQRLASPTPVGQADPKELGIAMITPQQRLNQFRSSRPGESVHLSEEAHHSHAPQAVSATGTVRNLVVMIRFSNHASRTLPSQADVSTLFNAVGGHATLAPTGSVRDIYLENSYNQLTLNSTVLPWFTLPQTEQYYASGNSGLTTRIHEAIIAGLNNADTLVNFSDFDADSDGVIDAITFVHSGFAAEFGGTDQDNVTSANRIWSHKWAIPTWTSAESVSVSSYNINPGLWGTSGTAIGRVGVIAHELGHFFGLPDLYDYTDPGSGIGSWGLMANSWGFTGTQLNPPHFSAWSKIQLGWVSPTILTANGSYSLPQVATSASIYRVDSGFPSGEYLLVENRQPVGIESTMPQGGLVIFHIDDNKSNNSDQSYPGQSNWPADHYKVAVLQADGLYQLEKGSGRGDAGDVYRGGAIKAISAGTVPSTHAYASGSLTPTKNTISNISASASTMTFDYMNAPLSAPTFIHPTGGEDFTSGSTETLTWNLNGGSVANSFTLALGEANNAQGCGPEAVLQDDAETLASAIFSSSSPTGASSADWLQDTTNPYEGSYHWFTANVAAVSDHALTSVNFTVPQIGAELSFFHHYNTEQSWDGAVVELSLDNSTWVDLGSRMISHGYNGSLANSTNPLTGRDAFTGNSGGYVNTVIDLSDFAGDSVRLRLRFGSDLSVAADGWYVDLISVTGANPTFQQLAVVTGASSYDWTITQPPMDNYCLSIQASSLGNNSPVSYSPLFDIAPAVLNLENQLFVSPSSGGSSYGGVVSTASDILAHDLQAGTWAMFFNAQSAGVGGVNAFHLLDEGAALPSLLLSFSAVQTVPGVGQVRREDIVKFVPSSYGPTTSGVFSLFLDGSTVGLTTSGEVISALTIAPDGRLVISTDGNHVLPGIAGVGRDEDLVALNSDGTWDVYLDGSDIGLTRSSEEIWAVAIEPNTGAILLSTRGNYSVTGDSGKGGDVFRCAAPVIGSNTSCTFSKYWVARFNGFGVKVVDGMSLSASAGGGGGTGTVTALAKDATVALDASGLGSLTATQVDDGSSADDGIASMSVSPNTFSCSDVSIDPAITLTVTDVNGVSDTDQAVAYVVDQLAPVVAGKNITVTLNSNGNASITGADVDDGSTDNCAIASASVLPATFTPADLGNNTVVLTVSDIHGNAASSNVTVTVEAAAPVSSNALYVSVSSNGSAGGLSFSSSDIIRHDPATGQWSMLLDASDVGLVGVNAFHLMDSSALPQMLLTMSSVQTVAGIGQVRRQDVVKFTPTSVGQTTAGSFSLFLDGSDFGLTTSGEYISALMQAADGRLVISTEGNHLLPGLAVAGRDEDLVVLNSDGSWDVYLDGSDLQMTGSTEEIWGASRDPASGDLLLSTKGNYNVPGATGKGGDVFRCVSPVLGDNSSCSSISEVFVGQSNGLATRVIDALAVGAGNGGGTVIAVAQDAVVFVDASGQATVSPNDVDGGSTADDGIASLAVSPNSFDCSDLGGNLVTLTVTDSNGASDSDQSTVSVQDTLVPVAKAKNLTVTLDANGNANIAAAQADDGSTDNCAIASLSISQQNFTTADLGNNVVSLIARDTANNADGDNFIVTVEEAGSGSADVLYMSMSTNGTVGGLTYSSSDVISYDPVADSWSMVLDASDVGISGINSLHLLSSGALPEMLLTVSAVQTVNGAGQVRRQDVLKFTPTSLGQNTSGSFALYLDGSDYGLTTSGEYLSAVMQAADGRLVVSTEGYHVLPGIAQAGRDEDLVALNSDGTWELYFDGSDVLLAGSSEELWGATLDPVTGDLLLTTKGNYNVPSDTGKGADILRCSAPQFGSTSSCGSLTEYWVGQDHGVGNHTLDALFVTVPSN